MLVIRIWFFVAHLFPQILQNIKSVLRQKYFSYDILYLLIKDVEVDFSIVLLMTTYKPLQN